MPERTPRLLAEPMAGTRDEEVSPLEPPLEEAMRQGARELPTPEPGALFNAGVLVALTSGNDLDSWPRQVRRRLRWMAAPALVGFVGVSALALFAVPAPPAAVPEPFVERQSALTPPAAPEFTARALSTERLRPVGPLDHKTVTLTVRNTDAVHVFALLFNAVKARYEFQAGSGYGPVTVDLKAVPLRDALDQITRQMGPGVSWRCVNGRYVVGRAEFLRSANR